MSSIIQVPFNRVLSCWWIWENTETCRGAAERNVDITPWLSYVLNLVNTCLHWIKHQYEVSLAISASFILNSQFNGRSRQCGRLVLARMGLGQNPLINGLIQYTFKLNFLFLEKFTVIPFDYTKLFPVDHKSPWCFRRRKNS